jgi:hypothetical protein
MTRAPHGSIARASVLAVVVALCLIGAINRTSGG